MSDRVWNFSAGPATLPVPVLEQARDELLALPGAGMSALEVSHRSRWFEGIVAEAESNIRELLVIPDSHRVLFLQGGASLQFSMVPMNLLRGARGRAAYVLTGSWSERALAEARREGEPRPPAGVPLACDASSDFLSRPIDVAAHGVLYAGAQKNAGPAGVTVAIVRDDVLERIPGGLPTMLDYRTHVQHGSLYNTPPTFSIYVLMLVARWIRDEVGGVEAMAVRNGRKAALLYEAIDGGFYRCHARPGSRSLMNVTFRLPTEDLEREFVAEAEARGLVELGGHRSVGGIRASIYNAMPTEGVSALRSFMEGFRAAHG